MFEDLRRKEDLDELIKELTEENEQLLALGKAVKEFLDVGGLDYPMQIAEWEMEKVYKAFPESIKRKINAKK